MLPEIGAQDARAKRTVDSINKTLQKMNADKNLVPAGKVSSCVPQYRLVRKILTLNFK